MANKFVKSVLERQAIEAKRDKQTNQKAEREADKRKILTVSSATAAGESGALEQLIEAYAGNEAGIADVQSTPNEPMLASTLPNVASIVAPHSSITTSALKEELPFVASANSEELPHAARDIETTESTELEEIEAVRQNNMTDLVSSYLIRTPERIAKNKTFYLDEAVINGIRAASKKQKVTESKLVNDILRGVLGIH